MMMLFPDERTVFLREQASSMYSPTVYFIAKVVGEIPDFVIHPTIVSLIIYFSIGLNTEDASHYFIFNLVCIWFYSANGGLAILWGSIVRDKDVAAVLIPALSVIFNLLLGFFSNLDNIPVYLFPISFINIMRYCYQALMYNEYDDLDLGWTTRDPIGVSF